MHHKSDTSSFSVRLHAASKGSALLANNSLAFFIAQQLPHLIHRHANQQPLRLIRWRSFKCIEHKIMLAKQLPHRCTFRKQTFSMRQISGRRSCLRECCRTASCVIPPLRHTLHKQMRLQLYKLPQLAYHRTPIFHYSHPALFLHTSRHQVAELASV